MSTDTMRAPRAEEYPALLALNNAHATELSWQDPAAFAALLDDAWHVRTVGGADALLVAFDQDAAYDNANFAWFAARYRRFVYVDRIVVAGRARGLGHAVRLYRDLVERARAAGHALLACEINREPPNPGSRAFHERLGFAPVGDARLAGGKHVDYFVLRLDRNCHNGDGPRDARAVG